MRVIRVEELRIVDQSQLLFTISHLHVLWDTSVRERDGGKRYEEKGCVCVCVCVASSYEHVYDFI